MVTIAKLQMRLPDAGRVSRLAKQRSFEGEIVCVVEYITSLPNVGNALRASAG
jgi:hypothetical protein